MSNSHENQIKSIQSEVRVQTWRPTKSAHVISTQPAAAQPQRSDPAQQPQVGGQRWQASTNQLVPRDVQLLQLRQELQQRPCRGAHGVMVRGTRGTSDLLSDPGGRLRALTWMLEVFSVAYEKNVFMRGTKSDVGHIYRSSSRRVKVCRGNWTGCCDVEDVWPLKLSSTSQELVQLFKPK